MPLDVAAQREQEGLEPRPDPQRSFLTYRLPLDSKQGEGGREKDSIIITMLPHIHNAALHNKGRFPLYLWEQFLTSKTLDNTWNLRCITLRC